MDRNTARALTRRLQRDGARIAARFGLRYAAIEAERANVTSRYGVCYSDGVIKVRLRHAVTGRPLKYSSLVNTLCHELAHLRHFHHGPRFRAFYLRLLEHARAEGIYRPGGPAGPRTRAVSPPSLASGRPRTSGRPPAPERPPAAGPVQLALFSGAAGPARGRRRAGRR